MAAAHGCGCGAWWVGNNDQQWDHEPTIGELGLCGTNDEYRPTPRALDRGFILVPDELAEKVLSDPDEKALDRFARRLGEEWRAGEPPLILTHTEARRIADAVRTL